MNEPFAARGFAELELVRAALAALARQAPAAINVEAALVGPDGSVRLEVAGKPLRYTAQIKAKVDRFAMLNELRVRSGGTGNTLLICPPLSSELAIHARNIGLQFIDTAGNTHLNGDGIFVFIAGMRDDAVAVQPMASATITPATLRVVFALLAQPSLVNAPYAKIAQAGRVSTGAISKAFDTLEQRGFLRHYPDGRRVLCNGRQLLEEWSAGYLSRVKPKLRRLRFRSARAHGISSWQPPPGVAAWGGEVAADQITHYLRPASYTIYMDMDTGRSQEVLRELVSEFRLAADADGPIEIVHAFWDMDHIPSHPHVPLPLVYVDLVESLDPRNLEVAKLVFEEALTHASDTS